MKEKTEQASLRVNNCGMGALHRSSGFEGDRHFVERNFVS